MPLNLGLPLLFLVPVIPFLATPVGAQTSEPSTIRALAITDPIRVDGRLNEEAWGRAGHVSNFTQRELDFGSPVSEKTEVAILFSMDALYLGFWGFDSEPDRILANEMARDFSWGGEDNFELILDTFDDDRNGDLLRTPLFRGPGGEWGRVLCRRATDVVGFRNMENQQTPYPAGGLRAQSGDPG